MSWNESNENSLSTLAKLYAGNGAAARFGCLLTERDVELEALRTSSMRTSTE